jgi:hypothetical protein
VSSLLKTLPLEFCIRVSADKRKFFPPPRNFIWVAWQAVEVYHSLAVAVEVYQAVAVEVYQAVCLYTTISLDYQCWRQPTTNKINIVEFIHFYGAAGKFIFVNSDAIAPIDFELLSYMAALKLHQTFHHWEDLGRVLSVEVLKDKKNES